MNHPVASCGVSPAIPDTRFLEYKLDLVSVFQMDSRLRGNDNDGAIV